MLEYPEGWEEWVAFLAAHLPDPVQQEIGPRGATFFAAGDPPEVVVRLSSSSITVSACAPEREDVGLRPNRLGTVMWRRVPSSKAMVFVAGLIKCAQEMRLATYRECQYCEKMKPPEQMREEHVCLECAAVSGGE